MLVAHYARRRAGNVEWARADWAKVAPANHASRGRTRSQNAGLRYEARAAEMLERELLFLRHLCFRFTADHSSELCYPDGIAISQSQPSLLTVVEIKHQFTGDGWFQLHKLYLPVVSRAFPRHRIQLLEVVKGYDPSLSLPDKPEIVRSVCRFVNNGGSSRYGVFIWSGRSYLSCNKP